MKRGVWLPWFGVACLVSCWSGLFIPAFSQETPGSSPKSLFDGLTVERTGGLVGGHEEWNFSPRGLRWKAGEEAARVPTDKLITLAKVVLEKKQSARSRAAETSACFDCFVFRVTVWQADSPVTLELVEAGATTDRRAQEALRIVRELVKETKIR